MRVYIPSALQSYTLQESEVQLEAASLADLLSVLDQRYPGIRFRIITEQDVVRPHIRIFVNDEQQQDMTTPLHREGYVYIVCALSGG